jgi:DNA polymerase I-like protein with 3'-5' exonuclease and polymerase domains
MNLLSMFDFYQKEIQSQWLATQAMTLGGMKIDTTALVSLRKKLREEIAETESQIAKLVGWVPNTKSPIDMERLLVGFGVVPKRTKKDKAKIGEDDLLDYAHRWPACRPVVTLCLNITERRTLQSNFLGMALDGEDFYHPTYRLNGTKSGRFASEGADEGGPQGQNWPESLLHIVIPDRPGHILIESDMEQAEDMIIAYDADDRVAIQAFENKVDSHRLKACWIFKNWPYNQGIPPKELLDEITVVCPACLALGKSKCNHSQRFLSKSSGYAFKYLMGVRKFTTRQLPRAGVFISEATARTIRSRVVSPPVIAWQARINLDLHRSRWLVNLLGRKREFYGLLAQDGKMLRDALSWTAQSVVGVIAGRAVARLTEILPRIDSGARLVTQRHDSVLVSAPAGAGRLVKEAIQESFYSPIPAHGRTLNIPVAHKSGPNWGDLH